MESTLGGLAKDHVKDKRLSTRRVFIPGLTSKRDQGGDAKGWATLALKILNVNTL